MAPKSSASIYLPLLDRALEEEIGIAIPVSGCTREYFRNALYAARKQYKETSFDDGDRYDILMIFLPNNDEVWVCKRTVSLDD